MTDNTIPITTRWLLDSAGETNREAINSVYMIICERLSLKGTGFLIKNGHIVTNWHVVKDSKPDEIFAISNKKEKIEFNKIIIDEKRDLALLTPTKTINGGLKINTEDRIYPGLQVITWGFPLGYNGPAPLLSAGYISGFKEGESHCVKKIIVNGAFNPGNSGGPLFRSNDDKVIGVVVSTHKPMPQFIVSATQALANNEYGMMFEYTDKDGNKGKLAESQVVAKILEHYVTNLTQVMIGEAIDSSELMKFLKEKDIT